MGEVKITLKELKYLAIFLSPILFRLFLDIAYYTQTVEFYGYTGYSIQVTLFSYILSWLFLIPFVFLHHFFIKRYNFSSVVAILFLFVSIIPNTSLYAFMPVKGLFIVLLLLFWLIFFYLLYLSPNITFRKNLKIKKYLPFVLFIIVAGSVIYVSVRYANLRFWINLYDVYRIRWEQEKWGIAPIFNYLIMSAGAILPFFFVLFFNQKKWIFAIFTLCAIFLNYGLGGNKSVIFAFFLAIVGYIFFSYNRIKYLGLAFTMIPIASWLEMSIIGSRNVLALIIQRAFYIPARITQASYDFFSTNELDLFRQKFMRRLGFESPYKLNIDNIISGKYFDDYTSNANNGLFSDAYSNLGILGVLIMPFLLVFVLKIFDMVSLGINEKLIFGVIISCFIALFSVSFSIALLSSGLILMAFILYSVKRSKILTY